MPWRIDHRVAVWSDRSLPLQVELDRPCCVANGPWGRLAFWNFECLGDRARQSARRVEVYSRRRALFARYEIGRPGERRCDAVWRVVPSSLDGVTLAVEWLVAWQTRELQDRVDYRATTRLPSHHLWVCEEGCRPVASLPVAFGSSVRGVAACCGETAAYVELLWPGDGEELALAADGERARLEWRLREPHLEKGVIRQFRFRSYFLQGPLHEGRIDACLREFAESPTPLGA